MKYTTNKLTLISVIAATFSVYGCGNGEADEAKKLGFASVDEMKQIHAKGWHTKARYDEDEAIKQGYKSVAEMRAEIEKKKADEEKSRLAKLNEEKVMAEQERAEKAAQPKYGMNGFAMVGGYKYTFEDIIVEGNSMLDKQGDPPALVTIYAYVSYGIDIPNDPMANLQFDIYGGEPSKYGKVTFEPSKRLTVVMRPQYYSEEEFKDFKRTLLSAKGAEAMVKITGRFGLFSNTYKLFFGAKSIEIVDEYKKQ